MHTKKRADIDFSSRQNICYNYIIIFQLINSTLPFKQHLNATLKMDGQFVIEE